MGAPSLGRAVIGLDGRCLRAGLDHLAGVGVHAREVFRRLLARPDSELDFTVFAGSRWRCGAGEALGLEADASARCASTVLPGRLLEAAWGRFAWPPLERWTGNVDLFHGPDYFLPPHRCPRRLYTVHDLAVLRRPEFVSDQFRKYFAEQLPSWRRPGTSFIAVSEFTKCEMQELLDLPAENIHVVHNGVGAEFKPQGDDAAAQARLAAFRSERGLPARFVLGVGSIQPRKNLLHLLRAWRILKAGSGGRNVLVLCGNQEWLSGTIRAEAEALGDGVRFISLPRAEMPLLYACALALVYPSFYEGFGLPLLEAMASGCPVAASRTGAHLEVAGGAAIYFPPNDTGSMARVLEQILDDAALRSRLAAAGLARAGLFTWERAAAATRAAYLEALALAGRRPFPYRSSESETYLVSR